MGLVPHLVKVTGSPRDHGEGPGKGVGRWGHPPVRGLAEGFLVRTDKNLKHVHLIVSYSTKIDHRK